MKTLTPYQDELLRRIRHAYRQRDQHWGEMGTDGQRLANRAVDICIKDAHAEGLWQPVANALAELQRERTRT